MKGLFYIFLHIFFIISVAVQAQSQNLDIKSALKTALNNNLELKTESYKLEQGKQDAIQAKLRPNPIFNTQILFLKEHHYYPNYPLITSQFNRQDWYQLTKKYQLFGQRKNNIQLSLAQYKVMEYSFEESKRQLLYAVATKWLDAWYAQIQMNLAKQAVASLDSLIEKSKPTNSEDIPNEYLRLLILDDEYDMGEISATQVLKNEINNLKFILQTDTITGIDTTDHILNLGDFNTLEASISYANAYRPDLSLSKQALIASQKNIKLQHSLLWPSPEAGLVFNPQNKIPYLGFFLTQPLPVFDYNQTKVAKAKIEVDITNHEIKSTEQKIINEVKIAYSNLEVQQLKLEKMFKAVKNANLLLSQVRIKYLKNNTVYVDLWEAESTWYETQLIYFKTEYELRKCHLDLLFATGKILATFE